MWSLHGVANGTSLEGTSGSAKGQRTAPSKGTGEVRIQRVHDRASHRLRHDTPVNVT